MSTTAASARFIAATPGSDAALLLRHDVALDAGHGEVATATLRVTALGVVEASIEGEPVSPDVLTPGWSSFEWRLRYAEHDVTGQVRAAGDAFALGLALGHGWYAGRLGWGDGVTPYGTEPAGYAVLTITFADGHEQVVVTDETWQAGAGATTSDSIYDGQAIDARLHPQGWDRAGFTADEWRGVRIVEHDLSTLEPYVGPPVRRQLELAPERIWTSPSGRVLVDFGQNLVGWVRVTVTGSAGSTVTLRHAEVLEHDELGTRPLRHAIATDTFTLSGGADVFEPTFTFHGFRYAEVEGWPGGIEALAPENLTAIVVSSELRRIGTFASSDPLLNQLHSNVVWGMRGNFLDVPTDCPQRDERLGWTGDIAAFAPAAAYLFDTEAFLSDWLRDLALEQEHADGVVGYVVPDILKYLGIPEEFQPYESTAIWSDAAVWVPWALWQAYGNVAILEQTLPSMMSHVRHVGSLLSANGVWDAGFQFGDWLDPDAPPNDAARAKADPSVVATASAYRSATLVAEAATVLGRTAEASEFRALAATLRAGFHDAYVADERIHSDCTTVYALAIAFDLLDADERLWAGRRLAELVAESDFRISTGFAGTAFITDALSSTGHADAAYGLLMQRECPSWLYPVTMGATTIWERWDSMLPDGTINPGEMTSFNHYALGAVADWMHRVVAGLAPLEPGYARILVDPIPGGGLEWAETALETPHGLASVRWELEGDGLRLEIVVPEGVTAVVPKAGGRELGAGRHTLSV